MTIVHKGLWTNRLNSNPMERAYHDEWLKENKQSQAYGPGVLALLLSDGRDPIKVSARDAVVAATVIQWLGSPVGRDFVAGVQGVVKEI